MSAEHLSSAKTNGQKGRMLGSLTGAVVSNIDGEKIVQLRVERQWTQGHLAREAHVSKGTMSLVENKEGYHVTRSVLTRIANILEVDSESLLREETSMRQKGELLKESLRTLTLALRRAERLQAELQVSINEIRTLIGSINNPPENPSN